METYQASSGPNKAFVFILGLVLGMVILGAGLYIYANVWTTGEESSEFKVTPTKVFSLSVASPTEGETIAVNKVKISGATGVATIVVINGGTEDAIIEAANGTFSVNYSLALGENLISVTAYDQISGESRTKTISVLYLNENLDNLWKN